MQELRSFNCRTNNEAGSPLSERNWARTLLIGVLLFLFLYNIQFSFLPVITSRIVLFFGFLYLIWMAVRGGSITLTRDVATVLGLCMLSFFYALMNFLTHGLTDASLTKGTALLILHAGVGGMLFSLLFVQVGLDFKGVVSMFQRVIAFQSLLIVLYFVSLDFRELNLALIVTHSNIDPLTNLSRARGFSGSYGASFALVQSFGLLFSAYLFSVPGKKMGEVFYLMASFMLIAASVMLTGRTGLLMLPVIGLFFFVLMIRDSQGMKLGLVFLLFIPLALALGYFVLKYGAAYFPGNDRYTVGADRFDALIGWIRGEVYFYEGRWHSTTFDILMKQVFFPENVAMMLFGDPATWHVRRVPSDIGPIRLLFGGGVVGLVLFYVVFIAIFLLLLRRLSEYRDKVLVILLFVFLFLVEFKEPFLMKLNVNSFLFILFFYKQMRGPDMVSALHGRYLRGPS